jgi:hypothetical protein
VGTDDEVGRDLTYALTSPLIRSLVRNSGGKTPHCRPSRHHHPGDLGFRWIQCLSSTASRSGTMSSTCTATLAPSMSSSSDKSSGETH